MGENGQEGKSEAVSTGYGHVPVLAREVVDGLRFRAGGVYVDCTVGYGGHAERMLVASEPDGMVIGVDRDPAALGTCQERLRRFGGRVRLVAGNFRDVKRHVQALGVAGVDGVLFDLGASSVQLSDPARGFSFSVDGPLDMRMDPSSGPTAADLVQSLPEAELADLIYRYGEERYARRIARAIAMRRRSEVIRTTGALVAAIAAAVPAAYRHGRIHFATRTFQALRIAVNGELEALEPAFQDAADLLVPGGRVGIIAFHSLEDRIAKWTLRRLADGETPLLRLITKKPIVASEAERQVNPRSRSAKLRIAERLAQGRCA